MTRATAVAAVRDAVADLRRDGRAVAFVPTMGALHAGHESLVLRAGRGGDAVVLSVFVNPLQFGAGEDFERYPRDLERDAGLAAAWGVDVLFAPEGRELLPRPPAVTVDPGPLGEELEGRARPGHFRGVLTIVAKLLHVVGPDRAVFGQKDLQQVVLVREMARDLDFPLRIETAPTVREADGLALSSRNAYLSREERALAPELHRALAAGAAAVRQGVGRAEEVRRRILDRLGRTPRLEPEYVAVRRAADLAVVDALEGEIALLAAVRLGSTRLLDNLLLAAEALRA